MGFRRNADGTWSPYEPPSKLTEMLESGRPPAAHTDGLTEQQRKIAAMAAAPGDPIPETKADLERAGLSLDIRNKRMPTPENLPAIKEAAIKPDQVADTMKRVRLPTSMANLLKNGFSIKENPDGSIDLIPDETHDNNAPRIVDMPRPVTSMSGEPMKDIPMKEDEEIPDADWSQPYVDFDDITRKAREDAERRYRERKASKK